MINLITIYVVNTRVMRTIRACPLAHALNFVNYMFSVVQQVSIDEDLLRNDCVCVTMHALCSNYSTDSIFAYLFTYIVYCV
jgi:hypothetical protein